MGRVVYASTINVYGPSAPGQAGPRRTSPAAIALRAHQARRRGVGAGARRRRGVPAGRRLRAGHEGQLPIAGAPARARRARAPGRRPNRRTLVHSTTPPRPSRWRSRATSGRGCTTSPTATCTPSTPSCAASSARWARVGASGTFRPRCGRYWPSPIRQRASSAGASRAALLDKLVEDVACRGAGSWRLAVRPRFGSLDAGWDATDLGSRSRRRDSALLIGIALAAQLATAAPSKAYAAGRSASGRDRRARTAAARTSPDPSRRRLGSRAVLMAGGAGVAPAGRAGRRFPPPQARSWSRRRSAPSTTSVAAAADAVRRQVACGRRRAVRALRPVGWRSLCPASGRSRRGVGRLLGGALVGGLVVGLTNAFNFMDGIDGIAASAGRRGGGGGVGWWSGGPWTCRASRAWPGRW